MYLKIPNNMLFQYLFILKNSQKSRFEYFLQMQVVFNDKNRLVNIF